MALGEFTGLAVADRPQPEQFDDLVDAGVGGRRSKEVAEGAADGERPARDLEVGPDGDVVEEFEGLPGPGEASMGEVVGAAAVAPGKTMLE